MIVVDEKMEEFYYNKKATHMKFNGNGEHINIYVYTFLYGRVQAYAHHNSHPYA